MIVFSKRYWWIFGKKNYIREIKNNNICNIINVGKSCDFLIKLDHKSIQI